jgi:hypothetical protein
MQRFSAFLQRNFCCIGLANQGAELARAAENLAFCYTDATTPRKLAANSVQMQQTAALKLLWVVPPAIC